MSHLQISERRWVFTLMPCVLFDDMNKVDGVYPDAAHVTK